MEVKRWPTFLNDMQYAVGPLNHTLWLAMVWLNDILEHNEARWAKEWPYDRGH